jgi:hypothetical protein
MIDAIAAAAAEDPRVEAVRERAHAAGYHIYLSLEAVMGFGNYQMLSKQDAVGNAALVPQRIGAKAEINANDKRFLRSLRIAADERPEIE